MIPLTPQHSAAPAHRRRPTRVGTLLALIAVLVLVGVGLVVAVVQAGGRAPETAPAPPATFLPTPQRTATPVAHRLFCDRPEVQQALAAYDDSAVIAAAGGGEAFRRLVISESAPCLNLTDPGHVWFVVNKSMPMTPIDYAPADWVAPSGMPVGDLAAVRTDVAASLTGLSAAAEHAGVGAIGVQNGYRGFSVQQRIHANRVAELGKTRGEELAARPGHSEHQSALAVDVYACTPACSSSEQFGTTSTFTWTRANSWRYGWIVRYEEGRTSITGYAPEAWHLRYIGPELAAAYHAGGFMSLEEFFGLPAAPAYPD